MIEIKHKVVSYNLNREHSTREIRGTQLHFTDYWVCSPRGYYSASVPCRAKLHHVLTALFYNWDWNNNSRIELSEEDARLVRKALENQKEYKIWRKTLDKINEVGIDDAKVWFREQIKILALRDVLRKG